MQHYYGFTIKNNALYFSHYGSDNISKVHLDSIAQGANVIANVTNPIDIQFVGNDLYVSTQTKIVKLSCFIGGGNTITPSLANLSDVTSICEVNSLTEPTAIACDSLTVSSDAVFPITANTTVTWTYADQSGNTLTQTQDIIISGYDLTLSLGSDNKTLTSNQDSVSYQWIDCDNGNAPINGETNQSFTPLVSGNYAVIIDNGICSETSNCQQVTFTVSDIENMSNIEYSIFPNPVNDYLNIKTDAQIQSVKIYDSVGKLVLQTKELTMDLSSFNSGVYYLVLTDANGNSAHQKIVKK